MKEEITHLQTDGPTESFESFYSQLAYLYADAEKIDVVAATRHINVEEARKWWANGFTPHCTFRETYNQ